MVADKVQCKGLGKEFLDLMLAVKTHGVGSEALKEAQETFMAAMVAADDLRGDTDAAVPYVISGLTEAYGDMKVGP